MHRIPITKNGFQDLLERLKNLKKQETEIAVIIGAAADLGDRSENAEYKAAKERQKEIQSHIDRIETRIAMMEIIEPLMFLGQKTICFGAWVILESHDLPTEPVLYYIVGEDESDLDLGKISIRAPLARALLGKKTHDDIQFLTPIGEEKAYKILDFGFGEKSNTLPHAIQKIADIEQHAVKRVRSSVKKI
jgi:transcription elongation factor GreA